MLGRLILLFTVIPLLELALLFYIAQFIGGFETFLLVIITGILGAFLARHEGTRCWREIQKKLASGQAPGVELIEGPLILLAGAFLITPGIMTDVTGLLLLVPLVRKNIARRMADRFRSQMTVHTPDGFTTSWTSGPDKIDQDTSPHRSGDQIIDVTFTDPEKPSDRQ
ncbi:MAG: FxsA family protein [Planctomycetia bacterium]|jgi:UPF0716 protein FxsA